MRSLESFVDSPYFRRGRNLSGFFKVIKTFYPEFHPDVYSGESIHKKLFPGKPFTTNSDKLIKTLSHELIKTCEEFLIHSSFKKDINRKNYYLLDSLRQKKLYDEYRKKFDEASDHQKKKSGGGVYDLIDKYFLQDTYNEFCIENKMYSESFRTIAEQDQITAVIALIRAYRSFEAKYLAVNGYNLEPAPNFAEDLINSLDSEKLLNVIRSKDEKYHSYVEMNHVYYLMSEFPDEHDHYFRFKKLVNDNLKKYGHTERFILYCRLSSYCLQVLDKNGGDERFLREEFENYDRALKLGLHKWSDKDDFSIHHFRNIFFSALNLQEFDWLKKYLIKCIPELPADDRDNMKAFTAAHLSYETKNYEEALENIMKIRLNFDYYKLDIKMLMFKIYHDMGLFEQAYSMLETMRHFFPTLKKLTDDRRYRMQNFVRFAKKVLDLKTSSGKKDAIILRKEIEAVKFIAAKKWLLERVGS